jgi:hypothetical protein
MTPRLLDRRRASPSAREETVVDVRGAVNPMHEPSLRTRTIVATLALVCFASLAQFHVQKIVGGSIQYDDALNANAAKNLAMGYGYSTSYHEIVPFDLEASTGPTILLPAAALVRLLGNRYWIPMCSIVACLWAAMGLTLALLGRHLTRTEAIGVAAIVACGLLLYHNDEFGLLGDAPGAFLASASLVLVCGDDHDRLHALAAGLLLGLAIETKMYAVLVAPVALACVLRWPGNRTAGALALLAGTMIPIAAWDMWRLAGLGYSTRAWLALEAREVAFVDVESGFAALRQSTNVGAAAVRQLSEHLAAMREYFGGWWSVIVFPAALASALGVLVATPKPESQGASVRTITAALCAAGAVHWVWWLVVESQSWSRHFLPAIVYLLIAAAIGAATSFRRSTAVGASIVALVLVSWAPAGSSLGAVFAGPFHREPRLTALLAARDEIVALQVNPDLVFVGWGWWVPRDLEYVLPRVGNFKDALRLQPDDAAGKHIVLVRNEFFNREHAADAAGFQSACDRQTLFRRDPFVISVCPSLPSAGR